MGAFDDLIPGQSAGAFDDLIPGKAGPTKEDIQGAMARRGMIPAMLGGTMAPDIVMGARQVLDSLAEMAGKLGGDRKTAADTNQAAKAAYEKDYQPQAFPGSTLGRAAGQMAATAPLAAVAAPAGVLGAAGVGALTGAAGGVTEPAYNVPDDAFWKTKGQQATQGAIGGAALGAAGTVAGKMLSGVTLGDAQQKMMDAGVRMTPGQALGGAVKGAEDRMSGYPAIGDVIKKSQFRGITDFNRAMYSKALAPFGEEGAAVAAKADVGNVGIQQVGDFLSAKYEQALPQIKVGIDPEFVQSMGQLAQMAKQLPSDMQQQFGAILKNQLVDRGLQPGQMIGGETMKVADSQLGQLSTTYKASGNPDQRQLGFALQQAQANLRDMVARQNPEVAPLVDAANQGWSVLAQMERAGSMLGAKDGIFTPSQLLNAIKRGDTSVRDRKFARGEMQNQDFAQAADSVLPNKVPDSGSAGRFAMLEMLLHPSSWPGAAMAMAAGAPYMPGLDKVTLAALAKRPQSMKDSGALLQQLAPYLGLAGAGPSP